MSSLTNVSVHFAHRLLLIIFSNKQANDSTFMLIIYLVLGVLSLRSSFSQDLNLNPSEVDVRNSCLCDLTGLACDVNCYCDPDCTQADRSTFDEPELTRIKCVFI